MPTFPYTVIYSLLQPRDKLRRRIARTCEIPCYGFVVARRCWWVHFVGYGAHKRHSITQVRCNAVQASRLPPSLHLQPASRSRGRKSHGNLAAVIVFPSFDRFSNRIPACSTMCTMLSWKGKGQCRPCSGISLFLPPRRCMQSCCCARNAQTRPLLRRRRRRPSPVGRSRGCWCWCNNGAVSTVRVTNCS